MSKQTKLKKNISDIIHKFFDSDLYSLTKERVKNVYNDPKININFENITKKEYKDILGIITFIKKNPDKKLILRKKPESPKIEKIIEKKVDDKKSITYKEFKGDKYVSFQRKAFINFINDNFYKIIKNETDKNDFKIYQNFVKYYLSLETPYRGLLVYHGLGTGKTATAITTAESLSENMEIFTLLPASLETNFIEEVKRWRADIFDLDNNNWIFMTEYEVINDTEFRTMLFEKYHISIDDLNSIYLRSKRKTKDKIEVGYWKVSDDIDKDMDKIKTIDGEIKKVNSKPLLKKKDVTVLTQGEQIQIQNQIDMMIKYRYNFIHYNPFPSVKDTNIKEFLDENKDDILEEIDMDEEAKTNNQKLVKRLETKLKENRKNHLIDSPFYNETIIIDEVHNFIRQIVNNKKGVARIFYEWIINAKNIKLICLSGTPVINKPSEISILYNMIRGLTKTYNFSIESENIDTNDVFQKCKDIFYKNNSPVDQIYVFQRNGKIIISFMQNTTRFESIMNPDNRVVYTIQYKNHDFDDFMEYIYNGLHQLYDNDKIIPSKNTYDKLTQNEKNGIIKGDIIKFNVDGNIISKDDQKYKSEPNIRFNIFRKLFTVDTDSDTIDLSENDKFMDYFFEGNEDILDRKRSLLKRMLLGLTSYYPIDRSSIVNMPEIILPQNNPEKYIDFKISSSINVELCEMSNMQFEKYHAAYLQDKERNIKYNQKNMYDNENFDYHINTRRLCNMIYTNDNFRYINNNDKNYLVEKNKEYDNLYQNGSLRNNNGLQYYSPKFNRIMNNIKKFSGETAKGKILFYSEFRSDSGAEIFERILQANGYRKLEDNNETKAYRYTFITGSESVEERRKNLELFNDRKNNHGEYVQIMVISGAGAEGISLNCVRQVHILEPYWNFVRIDQVLGRAIRMLSHIGNKKDDPLLPPNERNVEQFIYLSVFPKGNDIKSIYNELKDSDTWSMPKIEGEIELENILFEKYPDIYSILQKIDNIKKETFDITADEKLYNIMERKYKLSSVITDVIKESSVDCMQNTRDDINIHQNCLSFDKSLMDENSYFPGIDSKTLNNIDNRQLKATFSYFIKPDTYIVSGLIDEKDIYLYYRLRSKDVNINDIRYIKENGILTGILDVDKSYYFMYINDVHELDKDLGVKLSVFQKIFSIHDDIISDIVDKKIFPSIVNLTKNVLGYKIKNNMTEKFYYYPLISNKPIIRIYDYNTSEDKDYNISEVDPIIVFDKNFYQRL